ncbi:hypothetical protein ACNS7O_15585 (plasmid) [Haloferacaceae archaeon DSL9]
MNYIKAESCLSRGRTRNGRYLRRICKAEATDTLKIDRIRQLLDEQAFLDIIESRRTGSGHQKGTFTAYRLLEDPDVVVKGVGHDPDVVPSDVN